MLGPPEAIHIVPSVNPGNGQILLAEKRLAGIIRYLKQELGDTLEILEDIRANNKQLETDIARYEKKIEEQNVQYQQYESHNADLREKKRSYLERLKAVSILVSQQNFDAGKWGIVLDEMSFVSRELWDLLRRSVIAERTAIKAEAAEEEKFAADIEPMLRTRKELREQLQNAMNTYESQRSQIRLTEENLSRLGKIIDVYDAEFWQLSDVKSNLQMQIYKLEQMVRKNAQRKIKPHYENPNMKDRNGYDGGTCPDSLQNQHKFSCNTQKSHKSAKPKSHWAVESRSVRLLESKTPQWKTGREISKEMFDSSKEIAIMKRGPPVDVQVALHTESGTVSSTFSEISENDLTTPTVRVEMDDEETEVCFSDANKKNAIQNSSSSKVRWMERGTDVQSFREYQSASGNSAPTKGSETYLSPIEHSPLAMESSDDGIQREGSTNAEKEADDTSMKNSNLDSSYNDYKSINEATSSQFWHRKQSEIQKSSSIKKYGGAKKPADTLNSSSELVWASGTTAPGSYSPLIEKILGGRIVQRGNEDAESRITASDKIDKIRENIPESISNEEDDSEQQRELADYPTLVQSAVSSKKPTVESPKHAHLSSHGEIQGSGNSDSESTLSISTSNCTTSTASGVDSYDSNYGIPPQTRRTSSQSSFFEQPSYLRDESNDRSPVLMHVPHSELLATDDMYVGGEYRPMAEVIIDSALRSWSSSDDPCEGFSLPTSATRSSLSDRHITEEKFDKIIASIDLTKAQSPERCTETNHFWRRVQPTKETRNSESGSEFGKENDDREHGQGQDSSGHESFTMASPTPCSSNRSGISSISSMPDDAPFSLLESDGSRDIDERSGGKSFNITSNISYQSESNNNSFEDALNNEESKYECIVGGQVRLPRNSSQDTTSSNRMTTPINSEVQRLDQAHSRKKAVGHSSELAIEL